MVILGIIIKLYTDNTRLLSFPIIPKHKVKPYKIITMFITVYKTIFF